MSDDFSISIQHDGDRSTIRCNGALDLLPAEKLRDAVDQCLARDLKTLTLDCSGVSLLGSAGITALVDIAIDTRERGVSLHFRFSDHVRRVLDLVGLWWLGVIEDGIAVHASLQRALRSYADQSFDGSIGPADRKLLRDAGTGDLSQDG
jgi:anti-anti-sigma factor